MLLQDAYQRLAQYLSPLPVEEFFEKTLVGGFRKVDGAGHAARIGLLGEDPQALLGRAVHLAPGLTFHSAEPLGPPPSLDGVTDAAVFRARVGQFHASQYSVGFPQLRPLSAPLDALARAFEAMLHQPVTASAFWSRAGLRTPVQHDVHDVLAVQLWGANRWYLSHRPSALDNVWKGIPGAVPDLGSHAVIDVRPGDFLYVPRGTLHSVASGEESVHLAIGFTPLTLREAMLAALDHLSDVDRTLRATAPGALGVRLHAGRIAPLDTAVSDGVQRLLAACREPGFVGSALQRRSARVIAMLPTLAGGEERCLPQLDDELIQCETAYCHLTANAEKIDLSYPGGHVYIQAGAQESVLFMVNTPRFRVRDIPGGIDDDLRRLLAAKLLEIGYLRRCARPTR